MGYIHEDELIQFLNQDNGTSVIPGSYNTPPPRERGLRAEKGKEKTRVQLDRTTEEHRQRQMKT